MADHILTQQELKEKYNYDKNTGIFSRKNKMRGARENSISGSLGYDGYIRISLNYKKYLAHRLAWLYETGSFPINQIDHINGIKSDNRIINLREATASQNLHNVPKRVNNTSGYKGVNWSKSDKSWRYQISINNNRYCVQGFKTAKEAYEKYKEFVASMNNPFVTL